MTDDLNPMTPPPHGVKIRMYRQGHGDCFLLCFPKKEGSDEPFFVLIDCGMKSASGGPQGANHKDKFGICVGMDAVIDDIAEATRRCGDDKGAIDLAVITHEHEDHVSAFPEWDSDKPDEEKFEGNYFRKKLKIDRLWLAWTEDGGDAFANSLRTNGERLITLALALERSKALGLSGGGIELAEELLRTEMGGQSPSDVLKDAAAQLDIDEAELPGVLRDSRSGMGLNALRLKGYKQKKQVAGVRKMVGADNIDFLNPEADKIWSLPDVEGVKVYPLGPPRNQEELERDEPKKKHAYQLADNELFKAVAVGGNDHGGDALFSARYFLGSPNDIENHDDKRDEAKEYYRDAYFGGDIRRGVKGWSTEKDARKQRRIDGDWLESVEEFALRVNGETNNTSLVLLFELPNSGKTLLFTGDAQYGNWMSWARLSFDGQSAKDLLGRCTFYKVGHHGSHNATIKGEISSDYANLNWMARGDFADDFVAMIPSNEDWAKQKQPRPWKHPLASIKEALIEKSKGRVMTTSDPDANFEAPFDGDDFESLRKEHAERTAYRANFIEHWVPDPAADN